MKYILDIKTHVTPNIIKFDIWLVSPIKPLIVQRWILMPISKEKKRDRDKNQAWLAHENNRYFFFYVVSADCPLPCPSPIANGFVIITLNVTKDVKN